MKFSNVNHALRWAYETVNRPIVRVNGEVHADDSAQAPLILSMCERVLPALHMAYVQTQFGREAGGFELLVPHLSANLGAGLHPRRGIEQVIRAYCGEKIGLREIRKSLNAGMLKTASYRNRGYDTLDVLHGQVMDILEREMSARGLLVNAETVNGN